MARKFILAVAMVLGPGAGTALAHDVPNMEHSHAFQQTGYGSYRQGHTVSGLYGNITIWSAKPHTGYPAAPPVRFARPKPITRAPGAPVLQNETDSKPALEYGTQQKQRFGD